MHTNQLQNNWHKASPWQWPCTMTARSCCADNTVLSSSSTNADSSINCSHLTSCLAQTLELSAAAATATITPNNTLLPTTRLTERTKQNPLFSSSPHKHEHTINYLMYSDADDKIRHRKGCWNGRVVCTAILHRWFAKGNCFSVHDLWWLNLNISTVCMPQTTDHSICSQINQ